MVQDAKPYLPGEIYTSAIVKLAHRAIANQFFRPTAILQNISVDIVLLAV